MRTGLAARLALVAVAIAMGLWLAEGLRAVTLVDSGKAKLEAAGRSPDPEAAREALSEFRRAGRRNPDPTPRLEEADLLLALDRERPAAALLEDVTRSNPASIRAWGLLSAATASFDARRSTQANGQRLALYGPIQEPVFAGTVVGPGGRRYTLAPGKVQGYADDARNAGANVVFVGWAGRIRERRAVEAVIVVARGKVVKSAVLTRSRPDLVQQYGPWLRRSGFVVSVPRRSLRRLRRPGDLAIFGAGGGWASRLRLGCENVARLRAC